MIRIIFILSSLVLCASCVKEQPLLQSAEGKEMVFTADLELTKTSIDQYNKVSWTEGDAISIFDGKTNVRAVTEDSGTSANFTAEVSGSGPWYAIYPYNGSAEIDGSVISTMLPGEQKAVAGSFAEGLNLSVAYSTTNKLYFKNVFAYIKFTVANDLISKITIRGKEDEDIAGNIAVDYNGGNPSYSVLSGEKEIVLTPENGCFEVGKTYYAAILPQTLDSGFTITYTDVFQDEHLKETSNAPVFKRSGILNIGTPDSGLTIDGPIVFACAAVKADLLASTFGQARFGKKMDGEIYKSEAADVTYSDLNAYTGSTSGSGASKNMAASSLWSDPSAITSFDELKYFIGLFNGSEYRVPAIFAQCANLKSVKLPYNATTVAAHSFQGCSSLESVGLSQDYRAVFGYTFAQCSSLVSLDLPSVVSFSNYACIESGVQTVNISEACTSVGNYAFQNCSSMTKFNAPAAPADCKIETIGDYAFDGCVNMQTSTRNFKHLISIGQYAFQKTKIKNLTIPECTSIGRNAFYNCQSLIDVYISEELTKIDQFTFSGCKKLTSVSCLGTGRANGLELPEGMTEIGTAAFGGCTGITRADMPSTMTTIGKNLFRSQAAGAINLTEWIVRAPVPPTLGEKPFYINGQTSAGSTAVLKVPESSVSAYKAAANWSDFSSVITGSYPSAASADLVVKGACVDVRKWGETAEKLRFLFPRSHPYTYFSDVTGDNIPNNLQGITYATSFRYTNGMKAVKASNATTLVIATQAVLSAYTGWNADGRSFFVGGENYLFYNREYTAAEAAAGTWIDIPEVTGRTSFIFNPAGKITVDAPEPPVTIIDKVGSVRGTSVRGTTINHPAIVILPNGDFLASQGNSGEGETMIYKSTDGGQTWSNLSNVPGIFHYGEMHYLNGTVYFMGTDGVGKSITISKSTDNGASWTYPAVLFPGENEAGKIGYHSGPNPFMEYDGRIYRAYVEHNAQSTWGALVVSAPITADLTKASSWTMSNIVYYNTSYVPDGPSSTWEEPTIFLDREGKPKMMIRIDDTASKEYVSLLDIVDYKTLEYKKTFIMPGGSKKFNVFWDEQSGKYWSVVSPAYRSIQEGDALNAVSVRNALVTISSTDLENWSMERTCVFSDNYWTNSYHYMDWRFDGDDIVTVFRCSFDEERGLPYSYHDSNGLGFFRIVNFRDSGAVAPILVDTPFQPGTPVIPEYGY